MGCLRGRVERVFYNSGTFRIFLFRILESDTDASHRHLRSTKVSGHLFGISELTPGVVLEVSGEWGRHQKYGVQFKVQSWQPWSRNAGEAQVFLGACIKLFDNWALLQKATQRFGVGIYDALMNGEILEIASDDIERDSLIKAQTDWKKARGLSALADLLQKNGLGPSLVAEVFQHFGLEAVKIISDNPYCLMEIDGFPFFRADLLAASQGIGLEDIRRIKGGVLWTIREQVRQEGHLFVREGDIPLLMDALAKRYSVALFSTAVTDLFSSVIKAVDELEKSGTLIIDPDVGAYTPDMYFYEREAAKILSNFLEKTDLVVDLDVFLQNYEVANNIKLSDLQREAVETLIVNRVLVVTGAPGTGKTTLIRAFVHLFRQLQISCRLMAPTGIAAKRLANVTETDAQTIHRALRYDGFQWGHDRLYPLHTQAIIVDEFSMVDQELFYRLLVALKPNTMIVLVGDDAQLPSVGPGNVLRELLACKNLPCVRLEHVFRQAETSDIVLAAHKIRRGGTPLDLPKKEETEFQFVPITDETRIAELIVKMAAKLKLRDANFQVLSPKYEGTVGVNNLNSLLRDELNPDTGQPSYVLPDCQVRVGDRLMIIKNNYKLNVYNGDIGELIGIEKNFLTLRIHGIGRMPDVEVDISTEEVGVMLKLAYAVTVHRCQGEEFETVILPLVRTQGRMLQRNLFYTAITRARKKVWLLGDVDAVLKAVANDKVIQRNTVLRSLITIEPKFSPN
jgi:exodeoxyribonuclease V alpha subunit